VERGVVEVLHAVVVNPAKDVNTAVKKVEHVGFVKNLQKNLTRHLTLVLSV
jgi:phage-related minor tail protein